MIIRPIGFYTDALTINTAYRDAVLALGPRGYWRLGETSGSTAFDSSGNGFDGLIGGSPTLGVTGPLVGDPNTAMTTNAQGDLIYNIPASLWDGVGSFSLCIWVKTTDTSRRAILYQNSNSVAAGHILAYLNQTGTGFGYSAGNITLTINVSGVYTHAYTSTPPGFADNNWHFLVLQRDVSTGRMYLDGSALTLGGSAVGSGTADNGSTYEIGANNTLWYNGSYDEVAFFDYVLSASEISDLYTAATT